ncbi:hypothetical protein [Aquabacterium sp.]|uniref:hypothetical protein n=1 Tax=Aquabacterium sp. TaxID=1872578 RepID=UPI0035AE6C59
MSSTVVDSSAPRSARSSDWPELAVTAWQRLHEKGLAATDQAPRGSLSLRVPGGETFMLLESDRPHAPGPQALRGAAVGGVAAVHAAVYQSRPDVGGVFISQQPWARELIQLRQTMPAVFDEQVRHLGREVAHAAQPIIALPPRAHGLLSAGANAYVFDDFVLCLGLTRERLIFNAELLEKCAKAYVLATLTGQRVGTLPWLVRFIANRRLRKDEGRAAQAYSRGEMPTGLNAY